MYCCDLRCATIELRRVRWRVRPRPFSVDHCVAACRGRDHRPGALARRLRRRAGFISGTGLALPRRCSDVGYVRIGVPGTSTEDDDRTTTRRICGVTVETLSESMMTIMLVLTPSRMCLRDVITGVYPAGCRHAQR